MSAVLLYESARTADSPAVAVRPMTPDDRELQRGFFNSLSAEARYCRFMSPLAEIPEKLLDRLCRIDGEAHVALIATVTEQGRERMVGEARYIADDGDPAEGEFAIAVADDMRGAGLGRRLLARLERLAAENGVSTMRADALTGNAAMIRLARKAGYRAARNPFDSTQMALEKRLADSPCEALAA